MSDNIVVLLESPLVRADFGRMTMGDFFKTIDDHQYLFVIMLKCIVEDVETIPFQYVPAIIEAFLTQYTKMVKEATTIHQLQKLFTGKPEGDDATR